MHLRNVKPQCYSAQRRNKCKSSDISESTALVYVSQHSKRKEKRHLVIERVLYIPNGPSKEQQKNAYYKCHKSDCNARAKISRENLEKLGICQVFVNNIHNHQTSRRRQLRLGRGSQDSEEDEVEENEHEHDDQEDEQDEEENSGVEFVDTNLAIQKSNTSMSSIEMDPLQCKEDISNEQGSGNPEDYCEEMKDTHILYETEKQNFEKMAREARELGTEPRNKGYLDKLAVVRCLKYGKCVVTTVDIPRGAYIGSFYGRLCRKLPKDAIYSFKISEKNEEPLFVNAESIDDRPLLA